MSLKLKMWVEDETNNEDIVFKYVDNGECSTLVGADKETLLLALDKCQSIINQIRTTAEQE
ncbi:hypothetical protein [Xenorhabdus sp. KK7.4]|uniref:hypothetical protein n=1 Tax=Xenorhabdus sp. KK7.4 TaxID=1851572 RepID=UPI000C053208|nr:hypothetical protein [Xenorhabdus sp. KK7.4]PHM51498.1 hypothetical protein Xekk_03689 [Xenorhabdus sp. KK7.4]